MLKYNRNVMIINLYTLMIHMLLNVQALIYIYTLHMYKNIIDVLWTISSLVSYFRKLVNTLTTFLDEQNRLVV